MVSVRPGVERKIPSGKVLPREGETATLVTSALPYVNNSPHLGNIIGSTLSADGFARYSRSRNRTTLYICATDEYGTTSETRAMEEGITPRELCDRYYRIHKDSYDWFQIGFDHFGRTSCDKHTEFTQYIFKKLYENGHFESHTQTQPYCVKDQRFLSDRFVEGICPICGYDDARGDQCDKCTTPINANELIKPRCKLCGSSPEIRESQHLRIKLNELQPQVEAFILPAMKNGNFSANSQSLTKGWLEKGLEARAMTRDLKWGVPVPLDGWRDKVFYVWFDAPIGYPSITAEYTNEWGKWWRNPENVKLYQFMGKDNVPFHTLLFPGYLIGTQEKWTMLNSLSTTEYLQYEDQKFSKSRNIGVFGENAKETGIASDVWRYYLFANRPETSDSYFFWHDFVGRNNSELLNKLGNFVNRVIKFVNAKYDSVIPGSDGTATHGEEYDWKVPEKDVEFFKSVDEQLKSYIEHMEALRLRAGLGVAMNIAGDGNTYLQSNGLGNELLSQDPKRCGQVVLVAINLIYLLSVILHPFLPTTSDSITEQLNAPTRSLPTTFQIDIFPSHKINQAKHLFKRIDPAMVDVWRAQYGGIGNNEDKENSTPLSKTQQRKQQKEQQKKKQQQQQSSQGADGDSDGNGNGGGVDREKHSSENALADQITQQGNKIRNIKAGNEQGNVGEEVEKLQKLKTELADLSEKLDKASIQ